MSDESFQSARWLAPFDHPHRYQTVLLLAAAIASLFGVPGVDEFSLSLAGTPRLAHLHQEASYGGVGQRRLMMLIRHQGSQTAQTHPFRATGAPVRQVLVQVLSWRRCIRANDGPGPMSRHRAVDGLQVHGRYEARANQPFSALGGC